MTPPPLLPWSLLVWETLFLGAASLLGASVLFSQLPISTAVIVAGLNLLTFSDLRDQFSPRRHFGRVAGSWLGLTLILFVLILWLGREPFDWLLG